MSRLIDADDLYRKFCGFEDSISESDMDKISATISSMPTAYDLDKVVEQLEEKSSYSNTIRNGDVVEFSAITTTKAIEIVKGGGVTMKR